MTRSLLLSLLFALGCSSESAPPGASTTPKVDSSVPDGEPDTGPAPDTTSSVDTMDTMDAKDTAPSCRADCLVHAPIFSSTVTVEGITYTICPDGPSMTTTPPRCDLELDFGRATWVAGGDASAPTVRGWLPIRVQSLPVLQGTLRTEWKFGEGSCPPAFASLPIELTLSSATTRIACEPTTITSATTDSSRVLAITAPCTGTPSSSARFAVASEVLKAADAWLKSIAMKPECK